MRSIVGAFQAGRAWGLPERQSSLRSSASSASILRRSAQRASSLARFSASNTLARSLRSLNFCLSSVNALPFGRKEKDFSGDGSLKNFAYRAAVSLYSKAASSSDRPHFRDLSAL